MKKLLIYCLLVFLNISFVQSQIIKDLNNSIYYAVYGGMDKDYNGSTIGYYEGLNQETVILIITYKNWILNKQ